MKGKSQYATKCANDSYEAYLIVMCVNLCTCVLGRGRGLRAQHHCIDWCWIESNSFLCCRLLLQIPVKLNNFLYPVEKDESLLETYMAAVAADSVK